jgi:hypothetical protein
MTPSAGAILSMREDMAAAKARGLTMDQMRHNANVAARSLGEAIAAVITNSNASFDGDLEKMLRKALSMREKYAAFLDLWLAE